MPGEQREGDDPLALEPAVGGRLGGGRQLALGESVQLGDVVEDDGEIVRVAQEILLECGREGRQALVEGGQPLLRGVVEPGAGVRHLAEPPLHEVALLGIEVEVVELLVEGLDPPVERGSSSIESWCADISGASFSSISWISGVASADETV